MRHKKIKVGMISLGCPKNQVDSEVMLGTLTESGYEYTPREEDAELIIVNTCGFIDRAKEESIETLISVGELKKHGKCKVLIATGCLTQRYPEEILNQLPEVDAVVGTGEFQKIAALCDTLLHRKADMPRPNLTASPTYLYQPETPRLRFGARHTAYVKVSEGCNYRCSFCSIPSFRGDLQSRTIESVKTEVQALAEEGVVEINLIAQSLTSFGWDRKGKRELIQLLKTLVKIDGIEWIRLFYTYPTDITDELIDLIASEKKICRYIDLPLQHIDDGLLKRMNRKGKRAEIVALIQKLRDRIPEVTLRSTFIVGFPGETKAAYQTLHDFVIETRFDRLGVFTYSQEEGTSAYALGDPVSQKVKLARQEKILSAQREIAREKNQQRVGTIQTVLVDGPHPETPLLFSGRAEGQAPEVDGTVIINDTFCEQIIPGDFAQVRITAANDYDLVGQIVSMKTQKSPSLALPIYNGNGAV